MSRPVKYKNLADWEVVRKMGLDPGARPSDPFPQQPPDPAERLAAERMTKLGVMETEKARAARQARLKAKAVLQKLGLEPRPW